MGALSFLKPIAHETVEKIMKLGHMHEVSAIRKVIKKPYAAQKPTMNFEPRFCVAINMSIKYSIVAAFDWDRRFQSSKERLSRSASLNCNYALVMFWSERAIAAFRLPKLY